MASSAPNSARPHQVEHAADIVKVVATPLQLAAVALMLVYGIVKALIATNRWKPSEAVTRLFMNWAFGLGLVALLLAFGVPLVARGLDRDDLIDGSVTAADGSPIASASVSAPPVGRQPVHLDGSFELRVPDHLKRPHYVVTATADGFKPQTQTVAHGALGAVDFQLTAQPVHAVREIKPDLLVGQFYGLPFVVVSLDTESPNDSVSWISQVTATLSNGPVTISLFPQFVTTLNYPGPYLAVTGMVPINPGVRTTIRGMLLPSYNIAPLIQAVSNLPDYHGNLPCSPTASGAPSAVTDSAFDLVQSYARQKFVWSPGTWTLHLKVTAGGQDDTLDKSFVLTEADVAALRDSIRLVKSCLSVSGAAPLAQDGAVSNYVFR